MSRKAPKIQPELLTGAAKQLVALTMLPPELLGSPEIRLKLDIKWILLTHPQAKTIYEQVASTLSEEEASIYRGRIEEIVPSLRYCAYNIGDASARQDLLNMTRGESRGSICARLKKFEAVAKSFLLKTFIILRLNLLKSVLAANVLFSPSNTSAILLR